MLQHQSDIECIIGKLAPKAVQLPVLLFLYNMTNSIFLTKGSCLGLPMQLLGVTRAVPLVPYQTLQQGARLLLLQGGW